MDFVRNMIENEGYKTTGAFTDDEILELLKSEKFSYIMIGGSFGQTTRNELKQIAKDINVKVLEPIREDRFTVEEFYQLLNK